MHSTLSFVAVILASLAFVAELILSKVQWEADSIAAITGALAVRLTCVLTNAMLMGSGNIATDMAAGVLLIIGLALSLESALRLLNLWKQTKRHANTQSTN